MELTLQKTPGVAQFQATNTPSAGPRRLAAALLLLEALAVTGPVLVLQAQFRFPAILREPAAVALPLFARHQGPIVAAYYVFLLSALLYVPLSYALSAALPAEASRPAGRGLLVGLGLATAGFQSLGFSRWVFVVPQLSRQYQTPNSAATHEIIGQFYDVLNSYLGLTVGEHLGFLAMSAWTLCLAALLWQQRPHSRVVQALGLAGGLIGAALAASVGEHVGGPAAPVFAALNLAANSLWTLWLLVLAGWLLRTPSPEAQLFGLQPTIRLGWALGRRGLPLWVSALSPLGCVFLFYCLFSTLLAF